MAKARETARVRFRCAGGAGLLMLAAALPLVPLQAASLREQSFGAARLMLRPQEAARLRELLEAPPAPPSEATTSAAGGDPAERSPAPPVQAQPSAAQAAALPNVYLGALLYFGRANWTFWLNDARFAPDVRHPEFTVLRVDAQAVTLRWAPQGRGGSYTFTLRPRQTYIPTSDAVREGRVAAAIPAAAGETARP